MAKYDASKSDLCYIVEGYTDVVSMHENGVKNVVSASGTALSNYQIKLIKDQQKILFYCLMVTRLEQKQQYVLSTCT